MKNIIRLWPIAALMILSSCSKKEKEVISVENSYIVNTEIVEKINSNRNSSTQVTCRMNMKLEAGKQRLNVDGNLKMKRNDVIQLSLQVLGLIEAGRMELTQDYILILNRIDKQYMKASYADIPFFKENGINFYTFQALLWNELFTPNSTGKAPTLLDYAQAKEGDNLILTHITPHLATQFLTHAASSQLKQTDIQGTNGGIKWSYDSWTSLNGMNFPNKMHMNMNFKNTDLKIELSLSRLHSEEKWKETRTNIDNKKLKEVPIEVAFKKLSAYQNKTDK